MVVPNVISTQRYTSYELVDPDCNVTSAQLLEKKSQLLLAKTPENSGFINQQLGLIESMINLNNPCKYQISIA